MLDIDGTIYQTLDVKERAWHATTSNDRSVGIEIANIGAYPPTNTTLLDEWYTPDGSGRTRLTIPARLGDGGVRTPGFIGHPARNDAVRGSVQGQDLLMYDLTDEQYRSLARLTATLSRVLPRITLGYPRGSDGKLVTSHLATDVLANYHGILGHFHVQPNKIDPGPALDWERLIDEARRLVPMDAASR
jgi:N-acetyl-anhydromuramyl-L-alanine amidase AmpD